MNAVVSLVFMTCMHVHGAAVARTCELTVLLWQGPRQGCDNLGAIDAAAWLHRHPERLAMGEPRCEVRLDPPKTT